MLNKYNYLASIVALAVVSGCKQVPTLPGLGPHKIDIQQGNAITQEMVAKLQPGMTPSQVRFVLGTPLLVDPFRTDRWEYVYTYQKQGELTEQRTVTVVFRGEQLDRIEGDVVAAKPVAAAPDVKAPAVKESSAVNAPAGRDASAVSAPAGKAAPAVDKK